MATTDRADAATALADGLAEAGFVQLLVRADGESIAAAGTLAAAFAEIGTPFQTRVVRTRAAVDAHEAAEDATVLGLGVAGVEGPVDRPARAAFAAAEALGADPDPTLALAGVAAGDERPEEAAPDLYERAGLTHRDGLAIPTADRADGLAHTTLAHAEYSGDPEAAGALVEDIGDSNVDRRLASVLAIDAVTEAESPGRAAEAIDRAIHPLAGGRLSTIGGCADVLSALAAAVPGLGVALGVGGDVDPALDAWRRHARAAHAGVRSAAIDRHDGLVVAHVEGPVETVARLIRDYRSPEPAVLAVGDGEAALATIETPAGPIADAAEAAGGSGLARGPRGYARFDDQPTFVEAVTGAI